MFVATGARDRLIAKRRDEFETDYVKPLVAEATKLGLTHAQLDEMIRKETKS
jgi:DNA-binding transcriptional regulator YhcF (GntR family)